MNNKQRILPWLIELGLAIAIFFAVAAYRGVFTATDPIDIYRGLCDAFFVPGALLVCFGLLAFCAKGGAYDIFAYGMRSIKRLFLIPLGKDKQQRYYDFKMEKEAKRGKNRPSALLLGLGFLAAAGLCLILFSNAGG